MLEKIVIATQNPAKRERYAKLLMQFVKEIIGLRDLGVTEKPSESGATAEENALIKAKFYCERTKLPALSEDEALYADFLSDREQPGVHVRRVDRVEEADDDALLAYWERKLIDVPADQRTGRWHFAYAFAFPDGSTSILSLDRPIRFYAPTSKIRIPGWPLSSLEGPEEYGRPHSEMTMIERADSDAEVDALLGTKLADFLQFL